MRFRSFLKLILVVGGILWGFNSIDTSVAEAKYPLALGENLIEQRALPNGTVQLFTELEGNYYCKTFVQAEEQWRQKKSQKLTMLETGLKMSSRMAKKDSKLDQAIEDKLSAQGLEELPTEVDYSTSPYLPPAGLQAENSCVGWATGYYLRTFQQGKDIGWRVKDSDQIINDHVFSPSFVYNQINHGQDGGALLSEAGDLLKNQGAVSLTDFPYQPGDYLTKPGTETLAKAEPHRIRAWSSLCTQNDSDEYILQKTKEYLNTGDLLVAGSKIGFNFMYPMLNNDGKSIIITDNYPMAGHAYVVVGYDDLLPTPEGRGAFKVLSSWGKEWGDSGYSYITYQAYVRNLIEGYVFTDLVNEPDHVDSLSTEVCDQVEFEINFSGRGAYDLQIEDSEGKVIHSLKGLLVDETTEHILWDGKADSGQVMLEGEYILKLSPYTNGVPGVPFSTTFAKIPQVTQAHAEAVYSLGVLQGIQVSLLPVADTKVKVELLNSEGSEKATVVEGQAVATNQEFKLFITREEFLAYGLNVDQLRLAITVKE